MKKRCMSLLMAVVMCFALAIPALADGDGSTGTLTVNGTTTPLDESAGGDNWSYDGNQNLTLNNGFRGAVNFDPEMQSQRVLHVKINGEVNCVSFNQSSVDEVGESMNAETHFTGPGTLAGEISLTGTPDSVWSFENCTVTAKPMQKMTVIIKKDAVMNLNEANYGGCLQSNSFEIAGQLNYFNNNETVWRFGTYNVSAPYGPYPYTCTISGDGLLTINATPDADRGILFALSDCNLFKDFIVTDENGVPGVIFHPNSVGNGYVGAAGTSDYKDGFRTVHIRSNGKSPTPMIEFDDLPSWSEESVYWAVSKGITEGTSSTTFSPDETCTQAQILTFLYRGINEPEVEGQNPFSDVEAGQWYTDAATWAAEVGLVSGNTLGVNDSCTRAMVVTYLWKLAGSPNEEHYKEYYERFSDVSAGDEYATAVGWAGFLGITDGVGNGLFAPDSVCTRAQIVAFLQRAFGDHRASFSKYFS